MKICPKCGAQMAEDTVFCTGCGHKLETTESSSGLVCQKCGNSLPANTQFCSKCGTPIDGSVQSQPQVAISGVSAGIGITGNATKNPKMIIGIVVCIILIGGFWYYKHYTASPEFVISQIMSAYQKGNAGEFEKYFDVDTFSQSLWTDHEGWMSRNPDNIWSPLPKKIDSAKALKETIRELSGGQEKIEKIDVIKETEEVMPSMASILEKMHDYKVILLSDDGETKKFRLIAKTYDEQVFSFNFKMEKRMDTWKIVKLENTVEVCTTFKEFTKDSIRSYLKETQAAQDKYLEMCKRANNMEGKKQWDLLRDYNISPNASSFLTQTTQAQEYLKTLNEADYYRIDEFSKIKTNPFSDVINSNRMDCSRYSIRGRNLAVQWIEKVQKNREYRTGEIKELRNQWKEEFQTSNDFNQRVGKLIARLDYQTR